MEVNLPDDGLPKMPQFKPGPFFIPMIMIVLGLMIAGTVVYQVDQDEAGVVQRFGKYVRTTDPGLRFKLPFGIETVKKVKVTHVFKEEFGFRTVASGVRTVYAGRNFFQGNNNGLRRRSPSGGDPFLEESMMLSGDLNVAVVEWIVQYTVKDPVQFAFKIRDPKKTIRNMSEAVMRLVVGDHTINEVLTEGREEIQIEAQQKLQEILNDYEAGINVQNVILQDVTPPDAVKPSFNAVNEARQEKEKAINQAWEEYNRVVPKAAGQAEQLMRGAEGYALERINRAKGDAERFLLTWEAYKQAPEVTKKRLYLEMVGKVMPGLEQKLFMDDHQKGIVPLLNLTQEKGGAES